MLSNSDVVRDAFIAKANWSHGSRLCSSVIRDRRERHRFRTLPTSPWPPDAFVLQRRVQGPLWVRGLTEAKRKARRGQSSSFTLYTLEAGGGSD